MKYILILLFIVIGLTTNAQEICLFNKRGDVLEITVKIDRCEFIEERVYKLYPGDKISIFPGINDVYINDKTIARYDRPRQFNDKDVKTAAKVKMEGKYWAIYTKEELEKYKDRVHVLYYTETESRT